MNVIKERIEHLTSEIKTYTTNQMTFRTRMGFTVLIGPFIVMGAVLIATGGEMKKPDSVMLFVVSLLVAVVPYIGLAVYGARLDNQMSNQCNDWRKAIITLTNDKEPGEEIFTSVHGTRIAYLSVFALVLCAFLSLAYCFFQLLPNQP